MKKVALLICLALLLPAVAPAQRNDDPDVPVLKRRPAPDQGQQDSPSQGDSGTSAQSEPSSGSPPDDSEPPPPPPSRSRDEGGQRGGNSRRSGDQKRPNHEESNSRNREDAVLQRSNENFGFDRQQATPQFLLTRGGGAIRLTVNDPEDAEGAAQISTRLRDLAAKYARGEGVDKLKDLRGKITYTAHSIQDGAEMIISSQDQKAVAAIHQFLDQMRRQNGDNDDTERP